MSGGCADVHTNMLFAVLDVFPSRLYNRAVHDELLQKGIMYGSIPDIAFWCNIILKLLIIIVWDVS